MFTKKEIYRNASFFNLVTIKNEISLDMAEFDIDSNLLKNTPPIKEETSMRTKKFSFFKNIDLAFII